MFWLVPLLFFFFLIYIYIYLYLPSAVLALAISGRRTMAKTLRSERRSRLSVRPSPDRVRVPRTGAHATFSLYQFPNARQLIATCSINMIISNRYTCSYARADTHTGTPIAHTAYPILVAHHRPWQAIPLSPSACRSLVQRHAYTTSHANPCPHARPSAISCHTFVTRSAQATLFPALCCYSLPACRWCPRNCTLHTPVAASPWLALHLHGLIIPAAMRCPFLTLRALSIILQQISPSSLLLF